jgi:hypothetical protein
MRIRIFLKKLISISVAIVLVSTLIGCFDLGDFNDESAYYAAFGDVRLVYQNPNATKKDIDTEDYSVKDYFYNKNTGEDFKYGDPKDDEPDEGKDIPQLNYVYMSVPLKQDLQIESVALYFNALQTCSLQVFFYKVANLPNGGSFTNIRLLGDPEYQQKQGDNNETIYEKIEYSDPDDEFMVANSTIQVKKGEWTSFVVDNWKNGKDLIINEGEYLLLRFINNSGANTGEDSPVAFRVTNLLIRAFS